MRLTPACHALPCVPRPTGLAAADAAGKSSTINALLGATPSNHTAKRVAVGATPGKTKHFQTLMLTDDLVLCDCPGLVFPSFVVTAEEMVVNGVLPIDQMRDYACEGGSVKAAGVVCAACAGAGACLAPSVRAPSSALQRPYVSSASASRETSCRTCTASDSLP